jgi:hypothetical protein
LESAENEAISEIETALSDRYDTDALFAQTGEDRHSYVLKLCRYLVLYEIIKRVPHIELPEYIKNDTAFARKELQEIAQGKKNLANCPRKTDTTEVPITVRNFISNPKKGGY